MENQILCKLFDRRLLRCEISSLEGGLRREDCEVNI